jgi:prophage regulatory protein
MTSTTAPATNPIKTLPVHGMSRFKQLQPFLPFCRETWRKLVLEGRAPQPLRLSERCTFYNNMEVHIFLSDPLNYKVEVVKNDR